MLHWRCLLGLSLILGACSAGPSVAADPPAPDGRADAARFEPAPTPFAPYRRVGSIRGVLEAPIPPKMPLGTGAVPVSGGAVRGSVTTGWRQSF